MGKSDPLIFAEYSKILEGELNFCNSIAFLGFNQENYWTSSIPGEIRHFYDIQLNNWNINDDWSLQQNYDLIICTRCAYFSKNPRTFIEKCKLHLTENGKALIDWGLGDHWRFKNYKVGWERGGEREFAYKPDNFLYSCYWDDQLAQDITVKEFWKHVSNNKNFGYAIEDEISEVVKKEVPQLVKYETKKIKTIFLWPEQPQLYIITLI